MKKLILASAVVFGAISSGQVMAADAAAGKAKYDAVCASCHGAAGKAPIMPTYPKLAGQNAAYLELAIKAYKAGERSSANAAAMVAMAGMLATDDDIANVAAYLSEQ